MPIYHVEITETLSKIIEIKADSADAALDQAHQQYRQQLIILDSDDYQHTDFKVMNDI